MTQIREHPMKIKKFHQLVMVEHGPANTAIIDLLKGNVYQVENGVMDQFQRGDYAGIAEFVKSLETEELLIEIDEERWIPRLSYPPELDEAIAFDLEVEAGVDWHLVENKFKGASISRIIWCGDDANAPTKPPWAKALTAKPRDFAACTASATIDGNFTKIDEPRYHFYTQYNSCWGKKIAVTKDGQVRPCIHSEIAYADLTQHPLPDILKHAKEYWTLTKAKVQRCRDCELKSVCFDCREIARREQGDLTAPNPLCRYEPATGEWRA